MASTPSEAAAPVASDYITLSVPEIRGNEWRYVKECLDTNWVSSVGPFVDRFETMVADYLGAEHAVATVNGTAALHIALLLAGVEPDTTASIQSLKNATSPPPCVPGPAGASWSAPNFSRSRPSDDTSLTSVGFA